ncbi:DMT family transporter [Paeniglutamicibacter kerguelensis]|uniref:DMT family transporter n=1 Tax=Paeniglutamicibacter kerguelensis TaxID=254788 RepID=UPI003606C39B
MVSKSQPHSGPKNPGRFGLVYLLAAVLAGLVMPIQSRVNGALGIHLGDPVAASLVSFTTGLLLLIVISLVVPGARAGAKMIPVALRERRFPRWYLAAGGVGALVVFSQTLTVPLVGVALFTVSIVTGQTMGSMFVDLIGFGPGGRRKINALRAIAAAFTIVGVVWAVSPRLETSGSVTALLLPLLIPLVVGFLMGFQAAMNGVQSQVYGTPVAATLVNFTVGAFLLGIALLIRLPFAGAPDSLPTQWWYYLGGPLGCVFIGLSAYLVKHLGVLLTGLGMIGGQLVGSLLIDLVLPAPGALVNAATIGGTLLTLAAVGLASLAGSKSPKPRATR